MERTFTVASYLKTRLEELGLEQIFGVVGSQTVTHLGTALAATQAAIKITTSTNESHAFRSANNDARSNNVSILCVGGCTLDLLKSIREAQPPLLLISCEGNCQEEEAGNCMATRPRSYLCSHKEHEHSLGTAIFSTVTMTAEHIKDTSQAMQQIDATLAALLTHQKPVYLHIPKERLEAPIPSDTMTPETALDHPVQGHSSHRVLRACEHFLYNLPHTPSLTELARTVGTNRNTLIQEFQNTFGVTPFAWLREQRLLKAKQLLSETDWPIYSISENVGYSCPNHFSTSFRKRFGTSPRGLRKKRAGNKDFHE